MKNNAIILLLLIFILNSCVSNYAYKKPIDLSHAFDEDTIYWPTEKGFSHEKEHYGPTQKGYFYSAYRFTSAEHGGTHIDAPIHFNEQGQTLDEIPLSRLIGPGVVVDVSEQCQDRDYQVSIADFEAWENKYQQSLRDKIILIKTGFAQYYPDKLRYMGTDKSGKEGISHLHFPGLQPEAALWLVEKRTIKAVGIDTPSIDFGQTKTYGSHRNLFKANVPAFENIASMNQVPAYDFLVVALPMKIKDGSGGPLRIVALVPGS